MMWVALSRCRVRILAEHCKNHRDKRDKNVIRPCTSYFDDYTITLAGRDQPRSWAKFAPQTARRAVFGREPDNLPLARRKRLEAAGMTGRWQRHASRG